MVVYEIAKEKNLIISLITYENLKLKCPDHKCPHYIRNPNEFDPKFDSCDACLDDEYGDNF